MCGVYVCVCLCMGVCAYVHLSVCVYVSICAYVCLIVCVWEAIFSSFPLVCSEISRPTFATLGQKVFNELY